MRRKLSHKVVIAISVVVMVVMVWGGLDYAYFFWYTAQGYCRATGQKLSAQQRLDNALEDFMANQASVALLEIRQAERPDNPPSDEVERDFTVIPYASREEFLAANPDCCELTWVLPEGWFIGFWDKARNSGDGYFRFNYRIRYRTRDGVVKQIVADDTYYQVMNCGEPRPYISS
jgi:hypothetical protein